MTQIANLSQADVAATTRYLLVDQSNISAFPHKVAAALCIEELEVQVDKEGTGDWVLRVGVVEEADATDGSVTFFYVRQIRGISSLLEHISYNSPWRKGLSLAVSSLAAIGSDDVNDSTNWQTDVTLTNPTGVAAAPGAGDIVVELEEVDGAARAFIKNFGGYKGAWGT